MTAKPGAADLILTILKKNPHGLNIQEIAKMTGLNRMSVAKYLEVMTATEAVEHRIIGSAKLYYLPRKIPLTAFLEYTSKHYCITDSNLNIVQFHEWIPANVGITKNDMEGVSLPDMLRDRVVNFSDCEKAFKKALDGEPSTVVVEDLYRGKHKFFEISHMPVRFPDGARGMMAVSQDITKIKREEIGLEKEAAQFRDLVEHLPEIVFATDRDGRIVYFGPQVKEYGFSPENLTGQPLVGMALPREKKSVAAGLCALETSGVPGTIRFSVVTPTGKTILFEAYCQARTDSKGTCTGFIGTLREPVAGSGKNR